MMNQNLRKVLYIGGGVIALALVVFIFMLGLQSKDKTATLGIQSVAPNDPTVTIDGQKVASNGNTAVKPGKHTLVAKRKGFADKTQEVDAKDRQTTTVRILMTPNGQEGYDWLRNHPVQNAEFEQQASQTYDQESAKVTDKNPLISHLPEIRPTWRIDYGKSVKNPNDPTAVAIIITYGGAEIDKQNALQWIKDQGFNPSDYEIIFQLPPTSVGG